MLDDPVVLSRGANHLATFPESMGAGFLDIDVLTGLTGPDGHQGVPVVRSRDGDGVNRLILEELADISKGLRFGLATPL